MRLAREPWRLCARNGKANTKTPRHKATKKVRRLSLCLCALVSLCLTITPLNNTRVQFVVVSKHTLGRVVQKFVRIFPGSSQALQNAALQHILGTVALESLFPHAAPNLFHHVALRFEFGSRHDGTRRGHDPG